MAPLVSKSSGSTSRSFKLTQWLPLESDEQEAVIAWARMMEGRYPKLRLLHASMNGILTDAKFGAKLKRLGRKPGVPDLFLPVALGDAYGLWIEMKRGKAKPPRHQLEWHVALRDEGFRVEVAYGAKEAINAIKDYLGIRT